MGYRGGAPSGSVARVELDFSGSPGRPGVKVLNGLEGKNLNGMDPDDGPGPGVLLYLEFIRRENRKAHEKIGERIAEVETSLGPTHHTAGDPDGHASSGASRFRGPTWYGGQTKPMSKNPRGRPVKCPLPEPIPDSPENIARAILATPPRKREDWKHVREREAGEDLT